MWVLPTHSRPEQCAEVLKALKEKNCTSKGIVFVNGLEHEAAYQQYVSPMVDLLDWRIIFYPENLGALGALNKMFRAYRSEPFYGFIADDEFVETRNFDEKLIKAAGSWNFSHGTDGNGNMKTAQGFLCLGGDLVRAVDYIAIPSCWHWFGIDNMWECLAEEGACLNVLCDTVKIEHRHPYHGKGVRDRCYDLGEVNAARDHYEFSHWVHREMPKVVERIKKVKKDVS